MGGGLGVRRSLSRRPDGVDGKRVVIWLVAAATLADERAWELVDLFGE